MNLNTSKLICCVITALVLFPACGGSSPSSQNSNHPPQVSGGNSGQGTQPGTGSKPDAPPSGQLSGQVVKCLDNATGFDHISPDTVENAVKVFALASGKCSVSESQLRDYAKRTAKLFPNSQLSK